MGIPYAKLYPLGRFQRREVQGYAQLYGFKRRLATLSKIILQGYIQVNIW
ncbi:MAG: hypothetical protein HC939_19990 [Pleurocapsa sp. SU_5_0]|nr:hypothetical protein [Pleurocapsa sp. SU_5_0]NJO97331.1 hypothetical protein [Pleurocapsa sp. CRU_1_2]NJR46926.1 hypothetical protein [Hyellaceae cyanobacterium CSU_1_1]